MPPSKTFGEQMKRRRLARRLSANAAGNQARISGQRWRNLERGYEQRGGAQIPTRPTADTVAKIASVLDWDLDDALTAAGFDPAEYDSSQPPASAESAEDRLDRLEELWYRLSDQQQTATVIFARLMINPHAVVPELGAATTAAAAESAPDETETVQEQAEAALDKANKLIDEANRKTTRKQRRRPSA